MHGRKGPHARHSRKFLRQRKTYLAGTSHLADNVGWRLSLGLTGLPAVLVLAGSLVLPETPNSLMQQGHEQEARKVGHIAKPSEWSPVEPIALSI